MPLFAGMAVVLVGPRVQVSTQVSPGPLEYCGQRSWCLQTSEGREGLGMGLDQHEDGVEKELRLRLKMKLRLRFILGLGWWMPGP